MIRRYGWIALAVLVLDQAVKQLARGLDAPFALIPGVLGFTYAENTGMAFSLFSGRSWLLGVLSAAVIVIGYLVLRRYRLGGAASVAAMLMLGGAAGNMIDRFACGYVVDMFEVLLFRFAIFNVADAALTIGCGIMAASLLFRPDEWSEKNHGSK
ncbi:MAG: signal peptidase II [Clostridia bacterium]|nr:signal peptidase II [Clostridia bacterium]